MEIFIEAMGLKRVRTKFARLAEGSAALQPAFHTIAELIYGIEEQTFESQGRRGGGSWERDTQEWLLQKQRLNLDPRIGFATHALRDSVSVPGAAGQVLEIGRSHMVFGSDLPYAQAQQRHRPFIKWTIYDRARMRELIRDYLMVVWKSTVE
jgi:hypothetical protein